MAGLAELAVAPRRGYRNLKFLHMRNVKKDRQLSGLETAIRNALDRSNRADRDIRARIYQSARQALDAGLQKQGVSDRLMIMQQRELLEQKIHEIEMEEVRRFLEGKLEGPLTFWTEGDFQIEQIEA